MKKHYFQLVIASIFIGVLVKVVYQAISNLPIYDSFEKYLSSISVAIFISVLTVLIYKNIILKTGLSRKIKILLSYLIVIMTYFIVNCFFEGFSFLYSLKSYIIAIIITITTLPLSYYLEKKVYIYNSMLQKKQHENEKQNKGFSSE